MRIAIGGITNEALGSSPLKTRMQDFRVLRGQAILNAPGYGLAETARRLDVELVPLLSATHVAPSGTVEEAAYLQLRSELLDGLRNAGQLDGICLLLHGAMLVENIWGGDTDVVREVRASVGSAIPIAVRLDLHANLDEEFANKADIWTGYRTAPHRDARETLDRALALLVSSIRQNHRHPQAVRCARQFPRRGAGCPGPQARGRQAGLPDAGAARRGATRDPGPQPGLRRHAVGASAVPVRETADLPVRPGLWLAGASL